MDIIFAKIQTVIAETLAIDVNTIRLETHFFDDIAADSLDFVELLLYLETELGVEISDDEAMKLRTVEDVYDLIKQELGDDEASFVVSPQLNISQEVEYDENHVITDYIWSNYGYLMTDIEYRAGMTILLFRKANAYADGDEIKLAQLQNSYKVDQNEEANDLLKDGHELFLQQVSERLLQEKKQEVFINRCPECSRVVRTPKSKQCYWCGYYWGDKRIQTNV